MKLYVGIDWSQSKHDICLLNPAGVVQAQTVIDHSETGFFQLDRLLNQMGVDPQECAIGLETAHSILVDFLWDHSYSAIYVLPPTLVKGSRTRLRSSGARDDASDAFLIADILRTDLGRLHCWQPDRPLTRQIRVRVRFFDFLSTQIVRLTNRQLALLLRYFPAAADLFSGLNTLIHRLPANSTSLLFVPLLNNTAILAPANSLASWPNWIVLTPRLRKIWVRSINPKLKLWLACCLKPSA